MADQTIILPTLEVTASPAPTEEFGPPQPPQREGSGRSKPGPALPDDDLTLMVAGQKLQGWQDVRITRGIEVMPSSFALRLTERFSDSGKVVAVTPGETCTVMMGNDLVLTGYADTYSSELTAKGHEVGVSGRSSTQDLVDCQAGMSPGEESKSVLTFTSPSLLQLATDLCAPLGVTVTEPHGEGEPLVSLGDGLPQFTIALGQSVFDVLEPFARWRRMLMLDGVDGNLILDKVGTEKAASGFTVPGSVERARVGFSKQDRFTVYIPAQFSIDPAFNVTQAMGVNSANFYQMVPDEAAFAGQKRHDGKPRYRPRAVVAEGYLFNIKLAEERAKWQKARDYGRSQAVTVQVPTWRDSGGALWAPNTLAEVNIPALKLEKLTWIISEVTYMRGFGGGTRSVITLMPPEAFSPVPDLYSAYDPQIIQALQADFETKKRVQDANSRSVTNPGAGAGGNVRAGDASGV